MSCAFPVSQFACCAVNLSEVSHCFLCEICSFVKSFRCSLVFTVNFANQCQTDFRQFPCVEQTDGVTVLNIPMEREKVWLPFLSSPFTGTVDTIVNTVNISISNCKYAGGKLNQSLSTLTRKGRNNCMTTCCSNYLSKMGKGYNRKGLWRCQAWFKLSCMTVKRTIFWNKLKNLISPKSNLSFASRGKHKLRKRKVYFIYANPDEIRISLQMWLTRTSE